MRIIKYSDARQNLRSELDLVVSDSEVTCIISKNNQVVIIGKDEYDRMISIISTRVELIDQAKS